MPDGRKTVVPAGSQQDFELLSHEPQNQGVLRSAIQNEISELRTLRIEKNWLYLYCVRSGSGLIWAVLNLLSDQSGVVLKRNSGNITGNKTGKK